MTINFSIAVRMLFWKVVKSETEESNLTRITVLKRRSHVNYRKEIFVITRYTLNYPISE